MLAAATLLAGQASSFVQPLTVRTLVPPAAQLMPAMTATAAAAEPEPALLTLLEESRLREFGARAFAEPKGLLPLLQEAGIYGVVAYLFAFALFYASAVPLAEVGYHAVLESGFRLTLNLSLTPTQTLPLTPVLTRTLTARWATMP
jgi:hypothetical protein